MHLIHYRKSVPNFGDDLNADLWPALAPHLFANADDGRGFVGIGTIIGMDVGQIDRLDVFSSGAGNDPIANWAGKQLTVRCVRGPMTARLLKVDAALALTDGAILTPLAPAFPDRANGGGGTLVIPHFETLNYPGWPEACAQAGFSLLDPRGTPKDVIASIAAADVVLTESLHGAILADVYGIPWSVFGTSANFGTSKWVDWLAQFDMEFSPVLLPPPNARQVMAHGKRPEPYGTRLRFTLEQAVSEFEDRIAFSRPKPVKEMAKRLVRKIPPLERLLGFSPERTAEALTRLAAGPTMLSAENRRLTLRDRMLDTLRETERDVLGR